MQKLFSLVSVVAFFVGSPASRADSYSSYVENRQVEQQHASQQANRRAPQEEYPLEKRAGKRFQYNAAW